MGPNRKTKTTNDCDTGPNDAGPNDAGLNDAADLKGKPIATSAANFHSLPEGTATIVKRWICAEISPSLARTINAIAQSEDVLRIAIMPDAHEGASVPNGCVIATRRLIYPEAVGKDIGCGVSAIQFSIPAAVLTKAMLQKMLQEFKFLVPALKHSRDRVIPSLPEACSSETLSHEGLIKTSRRDGLLQLGTLGRGNHFVELQCASDGMLWAMVHSGSRAMGEVISNHHLNRAHRSSASGLAFLDLSEEAGQAYLNDMQWAIHYATESRLLILNRLADLIERETGADVIANTYIDCPHNFARIEQHFGETLIVHRKSANSARAGEQGIIPASMADGSRIVTGRGDRESLHSSAHGAGRTMSRSQAAKVISSKTIAGRMRGIVFQENRLGDLRDEAPAAYKKLNDVMRAQSQLVRTENVLKTILNYKGLDPS